MQQKLAPMRYLEIFDQVHAPTFHHLLRSLILRFLTEDVRYRIYSAPLDTITNIKMHRTASFKGEESIRCNERLYFTIRDDSSIDLSQSGGTLAPILRLFQIKWEEKVDNVNNSVAGTLQLKVPDLRFQEAYFVDNAVCVVHPFSASTKSDMHASFVDRIRISSLQAEPSDIDSCLLLGILGKTEDSST